MKRINKASPVPSDLQVMFGLTGIPCRERLEVLEKCCHLEGYPSWIGLLSQTHIHTHKHWFTFSLVLMSNNYLLLLVIQNGDTGGDWTALYTIGSLGSSCRGWWIIAMTSSTGITLRACSKRLLCYQLVHTHKQQTRKRKTFLLTKRDKNESTVKGRKIIYRDRDVKKKRRCKNKQSR